MTIEIAEKLLDAGLIASLDIELLPLTGGVSSDIYLVKEGEKSFVAKQALSQLKVAADWKADLSRNRYEQRYLQYVGDFLPDAVPKVLAADENAGFFTMEFLGENFENWKQRLLADQLDVDVLERVVDILATIHNRGYQDSEARELFDSDNNFTELRVSPYFYALVEQFPDLKHQILSYSERLLHCKETLVHGDFSPKNILISKERAVLLDCEVAWYGDPAFDVAFLINHLLLKQKHLSNAAFGQAALHVHERYIQKTGRDLTDRLLELIPMLLLARAAGKSPAEYLTAEEKQSTAEIACQFIQTPPESMQDLLEKWSTQ